MRAVGMLLALIFAFSGVALADGPQGKWSMADRKVIVKLQPCGENHLVICAGRRRQQTLASSLLLFSPAFV